MEVSMNEDKKPKFLKLRNGTDNRPFRYTDLLASRGDMIPCDEHGNRILSGEVVDQDINMVEPLGKSKYLGNTSNLVLYNYTEILAKHPDMESISTIEQWELRKAEIARDRGIEPTVHPDTIAPVLERETPPPAVTTETSTPVPPADAGEAHKIPPIVGLGPRDAKTVLADWAEKHHNTKLDRRPGLADVIDACALLIESSKKSAAG